MGLRVQLLWSGRYTHETGPLVAKGTFGQGSEPVGSFSTTDGTGAGQANQVFAKDLSVLAGATVTYDLKGGGGELDVQNLPLAMTAVKMVLVELTTPAAATSLRFGPQNQTDAALLWFQAATANFWEEVLDKVMHADARAGWALDATHKVIAIHNPGAATVAGKLRVVGVK